MTTETLSTLRALVQAAGLTNVRVRKGTGSHSAGILFSMKIDATRAEREAAASFLISLRAVVLFGSPVSTAVRPDVLGGYRFDSTTVLSFAAPAVAA